MLIVCYIENTSAKLTVF